MQISEDQTSRLDSHWMLEALEQAQQAYDADEVPIGAVLVRDGVIIGRGYNQTISACDPSAHAEILALRDAGKNVENYRLPGATVYVTVEPCTMCFGALVHARIARLVYATAEPKAGVVESNRCLTLDHFNHQFEVQGGILAEPAAKLMRDFFAARRSKK